MLDPKMRWSTAPATTSGTAGAPAMHRDQLPALEDGPNGGKAHEHPLAGVQGQPRPVPKYPASTSHVRELDVAESRRRYAGGASTSEAEAMPLLLGVQ
jgi:hypothetical protein